ncbi:MAG: cytochrome C, partial [Marinobacter sp.]|nr:cytochrome C [Marinobacter sp.]
MKLKQTISLLAGLLVASMATQAEPEVPVDLPSFKEGQYVHQAPTVQDLMADESIHPELKKVILKGRDMFMNTQQLRGKYVFNDLDCKSCHMGEGRMNWSGPVWPAATTLPDFRGKNQHVNSLEERIAGCFSFS